MIQDYSDPKVTLSQIYASATNGTEATLGACVIGPNYRICSYKTEGSDARIGKDATVADGFTAAYPIKLTAEQTVKSGSTRVAVKNAKLLYATYAASDSYVFSLSNGILTIKLNGQDVAVAGRVSLPVVVENGDDVLLTTSSDSVTPDTILSLNGQDQKLTKIQLLDTKSATITKVQFLRTVADAYVDDNKVTATAENISVQLHPTITTTLDKQTQPKAYPIVDGAFYAQYRAFDTHFVGKVIPIAASTDSQVAGVLGQVCPQNPLAMAVACATKAANGRFVYFTAIGYDAQLDDDLVDVDLTQAYMDACDLIAQNDATHGIVPCTANKAVLASILKQANYRSAEQIPYFKYLYASCNIPQDVEQAYVGRGNQDRVDRLIAGKAVQDKRAIIAFADDAVHSGMHVSNYCVAAAVAGLRSASHPHAPLSNVQLPGIQTLQTHGFTASQLKALGANGFLRVGLNANGTTIIRRQLTSAAADDVNYDEQSIVCNIDSICLNLKNSGTKLVGSTNISPALIGLLDAELSSRLRNYTYYVDELIGPQLLSGTIDDIHQDAVHKDRIYATLSGEPPKPFNRFSITFRMI